jgi:hypothetical protein
MSKREARRERGLASAEAPETVGVSLEEAVRQGYGVGSEELSTAGSDTIRARPVSIYEIVPDFQQPRRVMPSALLQEWNRDSAFMPNMMQRWIELYAEEIGLEQQAAYSLVFDVLHGQEIDALEVLAEDDLEKNYHPGVMQKSLMMTTWLAADIREKGLSQPIKVSPGNRIIFGERRWTAFHLLAWITGDEKWTRIPAMSGKAANVFEQASENTQRVNLNAVSMARQFALLLMELHRQEGASFHDYDAFGHDRHFYAQVADGNTWRIPRGTGPKLLKAMGIKSPDMLRKYRDLLRLPDAVWTAADDLNWTENLIRELTQRSVNERHLVNLAAIEAQKQRYTVTVVTVSTDEPEDDEEFVDDLADHEAAADAIFGPDDADEQPVATNPNPFTQPAEAKPSARVDPRDAAARPPQPGEPRPPAAPAPAAEVSFWDKPEMKRFRSGLLKWAYRRALDNTTPWFNARSVGTTCETLNRLVDEGVLEGKSSRANFNPSELFYRIAPAGCQEIGLEPVDYTGAVEEQARRELERQDRSLFKDVEEFHRQTMFNLKRMEGTLRSEEYINAARRMLIEVNDTLGKVSKKLLGD